MLRATGEVASGVAKLLGVDRILVDSDRAVSEAVQRIWLTQDVAVAEKMVRGLMDSCGVAEVGIGRRDEAIREHESRQLIATA